MRQRQPSDRPVLFEQVNDAPIGQRSHRHPRDFLERRLVLQRGVQQPAGFRQDFEASLRGS